MATYKKRSKGSKKTRSEKIEQRSRTAKFFGKLDYYASVFEDWVARNRVVLFSIIGVVVIGVLGYLGYENFIIKPRQEEAVKEMGDPLDYFNRAMQIDPGSDRDDFFERSISGAGGYGFLDIIENYKGTDAANLAYYSAGIAYLQKGEYEEAIQHLKKFKSKDEFLPAVAKGAIGDAYLGLDNTAEALKYYEEAASIRINTFTTPRYLLKAGMTAFEMGNAERAKGFLEKLEKDYPDSPEAERGAAYLAMAKNN